MFWNSTSLLKMVIANINGTIHPFGVFHGVVRVGDENHTIMHYHYTWQSGGSPRGSNVFAPSNIDSTQMKL